MAISVDLRADIRAVTKDLKVVRGPMVRRIASQTLNRTLRKVRTDAVDEASSELSIKKSAIRRRFKLFGATRRRLIAEVLALILNVRAIEAGRVGQQTRRGIRAAGRTFQSAFFANVGSGGRRGIFTRKEPGQRRTRGRSKEASPNLPIIEATIPIASKIDTILVKLINTTAARFFRKEFERRMRVELRTKKR